MRAGAGGIWIPKCMVLLVNTHAQCGGALFALRTGASRLGKCRRFASSGGRRRPLPGDDEQIMHIGRPKRVGLISLCRMDRWNSDVGAIRRYPHRKISALRCIRSVRLDQLSCMPVRELLGRLDAFRVCG
jgi:hypothetical protein